MDSKKYIGMDVYKESISIAVMNGAGKIVMECVIEMKASMILQFINSKCGTSPTAHYSTLALQSRSDRRVTASAGICLACEKQVNVRVIPTSAAIAESVDLAHEFSNRVASEGRARIPKDWDVR